METIKSHSLRSKAEEYRHIAEILENEAKRLEKYSDEKEQPKYKNDPKERFEFKTWKKWIAFFIAFLIRHLFLVGGKSEKTHTFRLFSMPSSLEGIGSIANMAGTDFHYNSGSPEEKADFLALLSDWKAVGNDVRESMYHKDE